MHARGGIPIMAGVPVGGEAGGGGVGFAVGGIVVACGGVFRGVEEAPR